MRQLEDCLLKSSCPTVLMSRALRSLIQGEGKVISIIIIIIVFAVIIVITVITIMIIMILP